MPSNRRLTTLAGATFVGVATTAMFAAPASAWHATVTGTPTCDTKTGTWTVNWSVDNSSEPTAAELTVKSYTPQGSSVQLLIHKVDAHKQADNVAVQTGVPANAGYASLKLYVDWTEDKGDFTGTVNIPTTPCQKETTPPPPPPTKSATPSAQPSASGGAGGGSVSASPSSAAPALPVTGSQTGLYAGGAAALLGAGAGLFFLARRRRLKFEV